MKDKKDERKTTRQKPAVKSGAKTALVDGQGKPYAVATTERNVTR